MAIIIDQADDHPTLKDLDFSLDGRLLVSLEGGTCRIWDVETVAVVATLLRENDEVFTSCRFSVNSNGTQILHITAIIVVFSLMMRLFKGTLALEDALANGLPIQKEDEQPVTVASLLRFKLRK